MPLQDKLVHEPIANKEIEELVKSFHSDQQGEFIVEVVRCVWLLPALHSQAKPQQGMVGDYQWKLLPGFRFVSLVKFKSQIPCSTLPSGR